MTSTRGKLHVLQKHFKDLGRMSGDSDFDSKWREQVETKVSTCMFSSILFEDEYLDGKLREGEIEKCICKLRNNMTGGSDGLEGELTKYGVVGMVNLLHQLFKVVWHEETVPKQ